MASWLLKTPEELAEDETGFVDAGDDADTGVLDNATKDDPLLLLLEVAWNSDEDAAGRIELEDTENKLVVARDVVEWSGTCAWTKGALSQRYTRTVWAVTHRTQIPKINTCQCCRKIVASNVSVVLANRCRG
jgi:hypothetical protein